MTSQKPGCLAVLLKLVGIDLGRLGKSSEREQLPYRLRDHFLSAAELSFFHVLHGVVGAQYQIAVKVRVSDLLYVVQRQQNLGHANRIDRKHVDFVLCDQKTMQPRLVIELDDASHSRTDRSDRDDLIDAAFAAAGLPLMHVIARKTYSPGELSDQIAMKITHQVAADASQEVDPMEEEVPNCPKCRIPMVQRQATKGTRKGKYFWGCPSYPACRETLVIE